MRRAHLADIPVLVDLMADFYAEAGYDLNRTRAAEGFSAIISDQRLGYVFVIEEAGQDVGHIVVTLRFAMEYAGLIACLDDLYVLPAWRSKGLATSALNELRKFCEAASLRAVTVEVGQSNGPAQAVYRRAGFREMPDRQILALPLADPAHIV